MVKWTKEILTPIVAESLSYAAVSRALGLRVAGGTHENLKRLIKKYCIDISHFLGRKSNCGDRHVGGSKKKSAIEILRLRPALSSKQSSRVLVRALFELKRPYCCELCKLGPEWNGQRLQLQIDHRNGKNWDDRSENIRFLCPNCHSQTENFGTKNHQTPKIERACITCGRKIGRRGKTGMCHSCAQRNRKDR